MAIFLILKDSNLEREGCLHEIWCESLILRRPRVLCSFCHRRTQKMYEQAKKCSRHSAPTPAPVWTVSRMRILQCGPTRTPPAPLCSALNEKSTLVQVLAWCRQAPSHYLSQCWPKSVLPYGVTRPWSLLWSLTGALATMLSIKTPVKFSKTLWHLKINHLIWYWIGTLQCKVWADNCWQQHDRRP